MERFSLENIIELEAPKVLEMIQMWLILQKMLDCSPLSGEAEHRSIIWRIRNNSHDPETLRRYIRHVQTLPTYEKILSRFDYNLPFRPYCTDDPRIGQWPADKEEALRHRYIQPNFGTHAYIVLDVDHDDVWWYDCDLPQPTIRTIRKKTGRSHWLYELQNPVFTWSRAKAQPREYLNSIISGMTLQAEADSNYAGLLTKNPRHEFWIVNTWDNRYTLDELDEHIRLDTRNELKIRRKQRDKAEYSSLGRNCYLFDCGRYHAYPIAIKHKSVETLYKDVIEHIKYENALTFPRNPLPQRECEQTAWSIAKWTFPRRYKLGKRRNKTKDIGDLRRRQANSAKATNKKQREESAGNIRKAIAELEAEGRKVGADEISEKTGLNRATVYRSEAWKSYKSEIQKK